MIICINVLLLCVNFTMVIGCVLGVIWLLFFRLVLFNMCLSMRSLFVVLFAKHLCNFSRHVVFVSRDVELNSRFV
jgi:hypothetical protein